MRIYHTGDLHDRRGIVGPLTALRAREPGLLVDCGDALRGSQTVYRPREPIVAELDAAGYDVQAVGNREFHYVFACMAARLRTMRHPVVCANLVDRFARELPFAPLLDLEREADGRSWRLRLFGLLVPQYLEGSVWERIFGWRFLDPEAVAERIAAETPADVTLVVLSHLGLWADRKLARRVPRLDLILGGHSHDTLPAPEYVGDVPIVHAGPYGRYVSRTELAYDPVAGRGRVARSDLFPLLGP